MEFSGTPVPYAPPGESAVTVFHGATVAGVGATSIIVRGQRIAAEVLVDHGYLALPGTGVQVPQVGAVHGDPAAGRLA